MEKVGNGERGTGNGEIRSCKLLVHPIIRQRRQRLLIKRKMTKLWFSAREQGTVNGEQ